MDRHVNRLNLEIKRLEEDGQIVPLVPANPPPETNGTSTPNGTPAAVQQVAATAAAMSASSSRTGTGVAPLPQRSASTAALVTPAPVASHLGTPTPSGSVRTSQKRKAAIAFRRDSSVEEVAADEDSQVYCFCQQVSFGEMVACDNENCQREWFHLPCVGLSSPPQGKWYCDECAPKMKVDQKKQSDKKKVLK
jgi:hypothetical protein